MALFAKKLRFYGTRTSYIALLALAKKKGGEPISYVVYRYNLQWVGLSEWEMGAYSTFPIALGNMSDRVDCYPTTAWLHTVASVSSYEQWVWTRVPVPRRTSRKRGKKPIMFGDLGCLYREVRHQLDALIVEHSKLISKIRTREQCLDCGYDYDEVVELRDLRFELETLMQEIEAIRIKAAGVRSELQYKRARETGIPLPNSWCKL